MKRFENDFYDKLKCEFEKALNRELDNKEKEFLRWLAKKYVVEIKNE